MDFPLQTIQLLGTPRMETPIWNDTIHNSLMVVFEKVCTEGNDKSAEIKDAPPEFMVIFQIFDLPKTKSTVKSGTSPRKNGDDTPQFLGNLSNQEKLGASKMHEFSWHLQTINMTTWNEGFN